VFAVKTNIPEIQNKLERLIRLVDGGWQEDAVAIMERGRKTVKRLTPKSQGVQTHTKTRKKDYKYGRHLREGWKMDTIGRGGKDRVPVLSVVYNEFTHTKTGRAKKRALLRSKKTGKIHDATLLDVLEYGSRAHRIEAVDAKVLVFEVDGEKMFRKRVRHPGTKPYGMIRKVRAMLATWFRRMNENWSRALAREWER